MTLALRILLGLYILQALVKFVNFFAMPYQRRIKQIAAHYTNQGRFIKAFDDIVLALMALLVALLAAVNLEHLSFITGLLVGLTLTQVFFHRFNRPLPPDRAPEPPASPIKTCPMRSRRPQPWAGGNSSSRPRCSSGHWSC